LSVLSYTELVEHHALKGILIDSNILLVWTIGSFSLALIRDFKRTAAYTLRDFNLIHNLLGRFKRVVTMPGIITEVSNLSGQLAGNIRERFWKFYGTQIGEFEEFFQKGATISSEGLFNKLGYTDTGIILAARSGHLVLTDDLRLYVELSKAELPVINFTHIRNL
jgi:hypothetical protein